MPPNSLTYTTLAQTASPLISSSRLRLLALFVLLSMWPTVSSAEIRVVTAHGEHRMGNRDTREDAVRLATDAAKRNALEQVAVYLESITMVDGLEVTKDEIRTYTAGLVLVLEQTTNTTLEGDTIVVATDLIAEIDTEDVRQAIAALRENEDARQQLVLLQQENDQLQQDLHAANQALAQASTAEQTQQVAQQRQEILNRVQSNAMVSQAWTDWVLVSPGSAQILALLSVAQSLYPQNTHAQIAQQHMIATRQPPAPPQPPVPPAPRSRRPTMPRHQITPAPGSQTVPKTLNEIAHNTPTAPPHIVNQAGVIHQIPPVSQQTRIPASRSARALQQFVQPSQAAGGIPNVEQRPAARQFSPTGNQIHPPNLQQAPRAPNQISPRKFSGSRQRSGVGQGGGGRGENERRGR